MEASSPILAPQQCKAPASSSLPNICSPGCPVFLQWESSRPQSGECSHVSGAVWPTLCSVRAVVGAAGRHLWESCTQGCPCCFENERRWGRGSLIRLLLFLNFCKSWSGLPGLKGCQAPCVWCWERWLCCYGTGGVSKPQCSGSWAGSQQHVLIAAVQQQNKYSEISIKAVIKGASLAF